MRRTVWLLALVIGAGALVSGTSADDKKPAGATKIEIKPEKYVPATTINFGGELGLPFESLTTLGVRIETARRSSDPVELTAAAIELAAAEKVAGKKASLTAEALLKEALETAKLRGNSKELKMIAQLVKDEKTAKDLESEATKAEKREKEEAEALKSGEKTRGTRYLRCINYCGEGVNVYVDGSFIGHIHAYQERTFYLGMKYRAVKLYARHSRIHWGPRYIEGDYDNYTWELRD